MSTDRTRHIPTGAPESSTEPNMCDSIRGACDTVEVTSEFADLPTRRVAATRLRALGLPLVLEPRVRARAVPMRAAAWLWLFAPWWVSMAVFWRADHLLMAHLDRYGDDAVAAVDKLPFEVFVLTLVGLALLVIGPVLALVVRAVAGRRRLVDVALCGVAGIVMVVLPVLIPPLDAATRVGFLLIGLTMLVAVLAATQVGADSLLRWSARRVGRELETTGPMLTRVLPVLMIAFLFFFYNAEIWQVMVSLSWSRTWSVVAIMSVMALVLIIITARDEVHRVLEGASADGTRPSDAPALRRAERLNLVILPVIASAIQVSMFAVAMYLFLLFFGWLSITDATAQAWTTKPATRLNGLLSLLPISTTLAKVSTVLAAFSALNVAASISADAAHRARFVEPLLEEVVSGLTARDEYVAGRPTE